MFVLVFGLIAISSRTASAQRSLYIPVLSVDSMLTLTNSSLDPATVTLTARSYGGAVLEGDGIINPVSVTLPASSSKALRAQELFGQGVTSGWAELQTASASVTAAFFLLDSNQTALDGAKLQTPGPGRLIFPKATTDLLASNRLVLVNTGNDSTGSLKVSAYENSGQLIGERDISLSAFSGFSGSIADLIPDLLTFDGYVVVDADSGSTQGALIGFETYRDGSDIAALGAIPDGGLQTGYLSQFGKQAGTTSTLVVINAAGVPQTITVTAAVLDLNGANTTLKSVQETLAPNERFETPLDQLFGFSSAESIAGYVRFQTLDSPGVFGYLQSKMAGGGLTAIPARESGYSDVLFSHIQNGPGSYTGLTLMNAGPESSSITIDAFDSDGSASDTATLNLVPGTGWSGLLSTLLPGTDGQVGGRVHITASAPILPIQIWGSTSSTGALAVMPAEEFDPSVLALQPALADFIHPKLFTGSVSSVAISSLTPNSAPVGTIVTITGSGFSPNASNDLVQFSKVGGGTLLVPALTANSTLLTVSVPSGAATGNVRVKVGSAFWSLILPSRVPTSNSVALTVTISINTAPAITAIPNQTVTLPSGIVLSTTVTDDGLPNGQLTGNWSVVSGPGTVTFGTPAVTTSGPSGQSLKLTANTAASFSAGGSYDIRLTASDGNLTSSADAIITVNVANQPPVVNAGANQTITLPATANLTGSATENGLPNGTTLTARWSLVSGSGTVTFGNATAFTTTATFSAAGTYVLQLTASDGTLTSSANTTITVNGPVIVANQPPVVNAGANQTITLPASANLTGSATESGLLNGTLTARWSLVSGPGSVTFGNATAFTTTATFSAAGIYVLQLTASDGTLTSSAAVTITVNAVTIVNQPPVVNAGANQTITLPSSANLTGSATENGLLNGTTLTAQWSVVSGPGSVTFGNATAFTTSATFSTAGTYVLQLTAAYGLLSSSSTTTVTVNTAAGLQVSAGSNQTITLPSTASLSGSVTDPCLSNCRLTTNWSVVSGPGNVTFVNPGALSTTATFSTAGTYVLQLTASDGLLFSSSTVTVTVNTCGTAVSGTVTLTANVTDSVGITGVQFQLDGANLGPQLTASPYWFAWVTTTVANGCHVISAAAQDANGNTGTATVNVFVNNP